MLLSVNGVNKQYGVDWILQNVALRLDAREKAALVGRNGCGKTTLLQIVTGQLEPDSGSVHLARGASIGYLRQDALADNEGTVFSVAESGLAHLREIHERLTELEAALAAGGSDADLEEYAMLAEHVSESDGYSMERDIKTVLARMGFQEDQYAQPVATLSGGEKTRLAIAKLLLLEPDLLILDEPTNHLDLAATEWLEAWIRAYHGAVLIVSHDRAFLENTVGTVVELRDAKTKSYPAGFRKYLQLRAEDMERQADLAARQRRQMDKLDEFVRRFINSQRTAQARGRQKLLNRLQAEAVSAPGRDRSMAAGFGDVSRSGDIVLECKGLAVGFPDETLIKSLGWTVTWQERWGVIGENGAGKSTLVKTLIGEQRPLGGTRKLGARVELGYFSQDSTDFDLTETPLEFVMAECALEAGPARDLLGRFLFEGDDVFKSIGSLSGGERNKLALAALVQLRPNLLVLDEPTNHLDMDSREALAGVLAEYKGTIVLVSHDRWFLGQVADHILDVRKTGPELYNGTFDEFRDRDKPKPKTRRPQPVVGQALSASVRPREVSKEIARVKKEIEDIEALISVQEEKVRKIELQLAEPPEGADIHALATSHTDAQANLARSMALWEELGTSLTDLQSQQG